MQRLLGAVNPVSSANLPFANEEVSLLILVEDCIEKCYRLSDMGHRRGQENEEHEENDKVMRTCMQYCTWHLMKK